MANSGNRQRGTNETAVFSRGARWYGDCNGLLVPDQ